MKKPVGRFRTSHIPFNIQLFKNVYQVQKVHKLSDKELLIKTKKVKFNKINKNVHKK